MRKLRIVDVCLQNFRSFVLDEFIVSPTVGLKFLGGENLLEPRLGANGAGKTSVWEAVVWCLYGKSIRGARTSNVIAWGQKEVAVSVQIEINGAIHCITRTGPPERIEISTLNSDHCTQAQVDELIGLSRERFLHAVIFGQGRSLFPDLSVSERGELFDEVLNLDVWTRCSDAASLRTRHLSDTLSSLSGELRYVSGQLSAIPPDAYFREKIALWDTNQETRIIDLQVAMRDWWEALHKEIADIEAQAEQWEEATRIQEEEIKKSITQWESDAGEKLELLGADIEAREAQVLEVRKLFPTPQNEDALNAVEKQIQAVGAKYQHARDNYARNQAELANLIKQREQLKSGGVCPTCKQVIPMDDRPGRLAKLVTQIDNLEKDSSTLNQVSVASAELLAQLRDQQAQLMVAKTTYNSTLRNLEAEVRMLEESITSREREAAKIVRDLEEGNHPYKTQLAQVQHAENPHTASLERAKARTCPFIAQLQAAQQEKNPHLAEQVKAQEQRAALDLSKSVLEKNIQIARGELAAVDFWKTGFKRIRLYFVNQILEALQIEIASAVNSLGLSGWVVKLATESETKSGTVKLGIQIRIQSAQGDEGEWETWSGGESQRLRLAMGMGLAALIQRAAGVWFDLEVWDEPSAWLSELGIEDLLEALRYRANSHHKQIWLVDHRALTYSGFREIWCVRKSEDGSKIVMVSEAVS